MCVWPYKLHITHEAGWNPALTLLPYDFQMAYETGSFEAAIAAAAGEDFALRDELRRSFGESVAHQIDLLARARCDGNWTMSARRLGQLGASFHSGELVKLAEQALDGAPGDPVVLRQLRHFAGDFSRPA